ncbi:MAG TPA: hypothetical protein VG986_19915 [Pseudolabrys sp.]|nr:hypothetical protein [Pseudolabrys sp.]
MRDLGIKRALQLREGTTEQEASRKKTWRRPEVICATVDQTDTNVQVGPEIVVLVS